MKPSRPASRSATFARLATVAALAVLASILLFGSRQGAQAKPAECQALQAEPRSKLFRVKGERWRINSVLEGSWCPSGHRVLEKGKPLSYGETSLELKGTSVSVSGLFKALDTLAKPTVYAPSTFFKKGERKPVVAKQSLTEKQLREGIDIEVCGEDGTGLGVVRCQSDWRGIYCGPVSGWRFALEDDARILVDADVDGQATYVDRVVYEGHPYWMPWHDVTCGPKYQYYDLSVDPEGLVTGKLVPLGDLGEEADVAREWNKQRLAAGVPPGVFDPALTSACQKHADYLKLNKLAAHEEDPKLPGYTKEGALAGMSSNISFDGKTTAVSGMLSTLYHRAAMLFPSYSTLMVGGNDYAYLMGIADVPGGSSSSLISERRRQNYPLLNPAPNCTVSWTILGSEKPASLIYSPSQPVGYPIVILLPEYFREKTRTPPTKVTFSVYAVEDGVVHGRRTEPVKGQLSYPGYQTPAEEPDNYGLIALTPYSPLNGEVYEAECQFTYKGTDYKLHWRFEVDPRKK